MIQRAMARRLPRCWRGKSSTTACRWVQIQKRASSECVACKACTQQGDRFMPGLYPYEHCKGVHRTQQQQQQHLTMQQ